MIFTARQRSGQLGEVASFSHFQFSNHRENMKIYLCVIALLLPGILALPEQGVFEVFMTKNKNVAVFTKSMYKGTEISVRIECFQDAYLDVDITWLLRWTPCAQEYSDVDGKDSSVLTQNFFANPGLIRPDMPYQVVKYQQGVIDKGLSCVKDSYIQLTPHDSSYEIRNGTKMALAKKSTDEDKQKTEKVEARKKREAGDDLSTTIAPDMSTMWTSTFLPPEIRDYLFSIDKGTSDLHKLTTTWEDGVYLFMIEIRPTSDTQNTESMNASVDVRMSGPNHGYMSAIEWPLLPFYGVMCVVYVIFGVVWLVLSACNWRDLLRIQFWIGGVIFLGMLEKAVFFADFENLNTTGHSVRGAMLFAELVSCLKRTLARMLVIIVSLGFGIVKPRLGPVLHKVLAMGGLYFILSAVEGCLRTVKPKSDQSNNSMLAAIPLAVLDAAICWWIFTGLVSTIRTLRLRRNLVKLSLYRHFTNTLVFAVVASVVFMVWSITQHKFSKCLSDWKELWVDEAFWHLLFSIILMVIMILWRPSVNNQRYAFSPLLDAADEDAEEPMLIEAFDGMKMRGKEKNGSPGIKEKSKADEDLKWMDENIPSSVADTALPSLLDSDEEMMNTKYEMSKME